MPGGRCQPSPAPPDFLLELPERTTRREDQENIFQCQVDVRQIGHIVQVQCLPSCTVHWEVDGQPVEGEQFMVEEEQVEEDSENNQFPSVRSTLTWTQLAMDENQYEVSCR